MNEVHQKEDEEKEREAGNGYRGQASQSSTLLLILVFRRHIGGKKRKEFRK